MTFLNPFLLIGLAAAAIPVVIHLLNLRKLRTVEFSSLQFLRKLERTRMRRIRLRQILLLVLRTLIIVAVVFAFSRPALKGSLAGVVGSRATTTMVVLLDDSPSMAVRNQQGIVFTQARDAAAKILALAKTGDQSYLLRLSDIPRTNEFPAAASTTSVLEDLGHMAPSEVSVAFDTAAAVVRKIIAASRNANKEVYFVTDGQATQFIRKSVDKDTGAQFDRGTTAYLVGIPAQERQNAGVVDARVSTRIVIQDKPVSITSVVRNFGPSALHNSVVSIYLDRARSAQQLVDIPPNGSASVQPALIPKQRGILPGHIQLEDDALDIDNSRYFVIAVPKNINVLLAGPTAEETKFPSLALTLSGDSSVAGLFRATRTDEQRFPATDLNPADVIVLCGMRDFSPADAHRISQFVRSGGGVILFPGNASDIANYNGTLFPALDVPPAADGRSPGVGANPTTGFLSFETIDLAHPLFAGMFEGSAGGRTRSPGIESPRIVRSLKLAPGRGGRSIISLSDGTPFLAEYTLGQGRVLVFSVEAGLSWSDFPLKGIFAPLMHRAVVYLAGGSQTAEPVTVGDKLHVTVRLKDFTESDAFVFRSPSGLEERVVPRFLPASGVATFASGPTSETGVYELFQMHGTSRGSAGGSLVQGVAVNVNPEESDLRVAGNDELDAFWRRVGLTPSQVRWLGPTREIADEVQESRYGVELWKYCIALAIALALAEMMVGRASKNEVADESKS